MDITLEGEMDGIEASTLIRSRMDTAIVYLSAHTTTDVFARAKITEPHAYLAKPISFHELGRTVETAPYKHEADKKVRESEYRLSSNLNSMDEMDLGIFVVSPEHMVRHMNPQWFNGSVTGRKGCVTRPCRELALRESQATYQSLVDSFEGLLYITSATTRFNS